MLGDEPQSPNRSLYSSGSLTHGGSTLVFSAGKPQSIRRGPGRPRKEFLTGQRASRENRLIKRVRGGGIGALRGMGSKRKLINWPKHTGIPTHTSIQDIYIKNLLLPVEDNLSNVINQPAATITSIGLTTSTALVSSSSVTEPEINNSAYTGGNIEKIMQPPEEPPYFAEKWPGKMCILCCLGERSQLGQGEMLRFEVIEGESSSNMLNSSFEDRQSANFIDDKNQRGGFFTSPQLSNRRQKGLNKCK